ncbi:uncharacterized protein METZ01_LOCUS57799, partial [marine metagenome]
VLGEISVGLPLGDDSLVLAALLLPLD